MVVEYRDETPFTGENHTPTELANAIRTKKYGKDVREPIAQLADKLSNAVLGQNVGNVVATPTKVFDNLAELQKTYPNGADGVMVTVDNGHKYFWQNNDWVDGGNYQTPQGNADATVSALHNQMLDVLDQQNKIWQRKLYVNVNTGEWLDDKNMTVTQSNWCWTPYYIPVKKNSDYIFAAYDSRNANSKVVGISSVYINLYSSDKSFIKQIYTNNSNPGIFNTESAEYIRFSMSMNTFLDEQYPSLFKGNTLPKEIENDIYGLFDIAYKQLGNSLADFKLTPSVSLPKMENLPVQIYDDTLIEYAVNTDIIKVFLYDNFGNLIVRNNSGSGWKIPVNSGDRALDFNAILGSAPESYWRYAPKLYRKQSRIFINEIPINAGKGQNIKVLIIGDSLTNFNIYPNRTGELANSDENTTIEFIGTRGDNTKHEGRGGWSAKYYCTKSNFNTYNNPFLNNGKFDFSNYMNTNNFSDVDIVIINLGTNDIALNRPDIDNNFSGDFKAYDEMISSIKAYNANIKIALGSTITPARLNNANIDVKTRRQRWNRLMERYCLDNNYTYIPYWLVVDPINDFKYEDVQIDDYNTTTIKKVADNTHPADSGYKKMGDLTYATIKKIAEDIRLGK